MKKEQVFVGEQLYDAPMRLFHGLFAVLFVAAFGIGKVFDDDSTVFALHMLCGVLMLLLVLFRIIWGVIGPSAAKWTQMPLAPSEVIEYFRGVFRGQQPRWLAHNPATSYLLLFMIGLVLLLAFSGLGMVLGFAGFLAQDLHEVFAHAFLGLVILHLAGLTLHHLQHRDQLWQRMAPRLAVRGHRGVAVGLFCTLAIVTVFLVMQFDANTGSLDFFGSAVQLIEQESGLEKPIGDDSDEGHDYEGHLLPSPQRIVILSA